MKLLLDENLSPRHSSELGFRGHDAFAVLEVGLSGGSDELVRRFAVMNGRVLITLDADFANVIRFPPEGTTGVVRLKIHPPTEDSIQALRRALLLLLNVDRTDRLAVVDDNKIRIRR